MTEETRRKWLFGLGFTAFILFAALAMVYFLPENSKRGMAVMLVAVVLPAILYGALARPLVIPFSIFVLLVPFDNLLKVSSFGTLTKIFAILSGLALLMWLVRNKIAVKPSPTLFIWGLFVLWAALSVFWAIDSTASLGRLLTYLQLFMLLAIISVMPVRSDDFRIILGAIVVGSLAAALYGIYLFHSGQMLQVSHVGSSLVARVFIKSGDDLIDPNHFGNALLLPISLISIFALRRRLSISKIALLAILGVLFLGIYVSGSRGALVAAATVMAYLFLRTRYKFQIGAAAGLILALSFALPTSPWARFATAIQTGGAGRTAIWSVGVDAFKHYWFKGVGVANFEWAYDQSFIHVYQRYFAQWHRVSHNLIIGTSVELGLIGLLIVLWGWYSQWKMLSNIPKAHPLFEVRIALEASIVGLFVAAMFVDMMPYKYAWLAFSVMALTRSLHMQSQEQDPILLGASETTVNRPRFAPRPALVR